MKFSGSDFRKNGSSMISFLEGDGIMKFKAAPSFEKEKFKFAVAVWPDKVGIMCSACDSAVYRVSRATGGERGFKE